MQLSCLLLMAAAAVPLLGEPQINKQTKEAKASRQETKASRLENRDKIREEESLSSSCPTGSTSFAPDDERSPLLMEIPRTANLFGQPGSRHRSPLVLSNLHFPNTFSSNQLVFLSIISDRRIPVTLTNRGSASSHLMLSHQEAFPVHSLDSFATHVELVAGIQPAEVEQISDKSCHGTSTEEEYPLAVVKIWIARLRTLVQQTARCNAQCAVRRLQYNCCSAIVAIELLQ